MRPFSSWKTVTKTAEAPALILIGAAIAGKILDIPKETLLIGATALYGVYSGIRNFLKNWKKGK
jgi:hypothetical protein